MEDNFDSKSTTFTISREALYPCEQLFELKHSSRKLTISIPKESSKDETRIGITPQGVNLLVENGHKVLVQKNAGATSRYFDHEYSEQGAEIVDSNAEAFSGDVVLKICPPTLQEAMLIKERATLFCMLKYTSQEEAVLRILMEKKANAVALDLIMDEHKCFPIVRSLSEIEGNASVAVATNYLSIATGGKGIMLGGVTGINPSEVVVLGAGTAGTVAARAALAMGASVKVFDHSLHKLRELSYNLKTPVFTSNLHPIVLVKALKSADVVIGTMRHLNDSKRFVLSEDLIRSMKKGSVLIDLSVDQGGCFETTSPTTIAQPVFEKHGVFHHCLPNISVLFSRTATIAFSNITSGLMIDLGMRPTINSYIKENKGFSNGVYLFNGIMTNHIVGSHFGIPSKDIDLLLAAF